MTATTNGRPINRRADHHCFGCGDENPHGLRLKFYAREDGSPGVQTDWIPTPMEEGYVGMVHGGLISTVCDEVMAWTCYAEEIWGMTARLSVRFRQPVLVGQAYRATGWIVTSRGRMVDVAAAMHHGESGLMVAEATAQFLRVSDAQSTEWIRRYGRVGRP